MSCALEEPHDLRRGVRVEQQLHAVDCCHLQFALLGDGYVFERGEDVLAFEAKAGRPSAHRCWCQQQADQTPR